MVGVCVVGWHSLVSGHSLCGHQLSFVFLSFFMSLIGGGKEREVESGVRREISG